MNDSAGRTGVDAAPECDSAGRNVERQTPTFFFLGTLASIAMFAR
jgi:hypothetical protein